MKNLKLVLLISTFGSNSPRTGFSVICVKNK